MKMQVFKKYKMKKLRRSITFACVALSVTYFSACDVLDKKPLDNISDATVWIDETLIDADITGAYAKTTVLTNEADAVVLAGSSNFFSIYFINNVSDESKTASDFAGNAYKFKFGALKIAGGLLEYWEQPYNIIRVLNEILERLPNAQVSEKFRKQRMAEVRFLRAFNYFAMVKRYGGGEKRAAKRVERAGSRGRKQGVFELAQRTSAFKRQCYRSQRPRYPRSRRSGHGQRRRKLQHSRDGKALYRHR